MELHKNFGWTAQVFFAHVKDFFRATIPVGQRFIKVVFQTFLSMNLIRKYVVPSFLMSWHDCHVTNSDPFSV